MLRGLGKGTSQWSHTISCRHPQTTLIVSLLQFLLSSALLLLFSWLLLSSCPQKREYLWATTLIALPTLTYLRESSYGPGLTHMVSLQHSGLCFWVSCYDILATNIIPTLFFPTLLPLAQMIWCNLFSQHRTGVAGSSLNELFRNVAASFPTQKPVILSENRYTPR